MIARTATPERWAGVFYTALTLGQFILAAGLNGLVMPRWGANGCFALVAGLVAASAVTALPGRVPDAIEPAARVGDRRACQSDSQT